jgi:hypothetical protein
VVQLLHPHPFDLLRLTSFEIGKHFPVLTQIVSNLLANAVKFVPAGTLPRVKISAETEGNRVHIFLKTMESELTPVTRGHIPNLWPRICDVKSTA